MKVSEYNILPSILTNRWESGVGELVNQMGLQNVLVISNVEDDLDNQIYYAKITRIGTGYSKLPYKDGQFECVILMYSARIDEKLESRLLEMKRVCKEGKYVFVVDTIKVTSGIAKVINKKWVKESHANYGPKAQSFLEAAAIKQAMADAGLRRPYMRKLFLGTCNVFSATKHTES